MAEIYQVDPFRLSGTLAYILRKGSRQDRGHTRDPYLSLMYTFSRFFFSPI